MDILKAENSFGTLEICLLLGFNFFRVSYSNVFTSSKFSKTIVKILIEKNWKNAGYLSTNFYALYHNFFLL